LSITIDIARELPVPIEQAWDHLQDLASHVTWMRDAESIRFVGDTRRGVGTVMICRTRVGPIRTDDRLEVVGWEEGRSIAVAHTGLVRGSGELRLIPRGSNSCTIRWRESLVFPRYVVGPLTERLALSILTRIWQGNLARFEATLDAPRSS
jgi:carbon monoxide dehydrogenase subunit G